MVSISARGYRARTAFARNAFRTVAFLLGTPGASDPKLPVEARKSGRSSIQKSLGSRAFRTGPIAAGLSDTRRTIRATPVQPDSGTVWVCPLS